MELTEFERVAPYVIVIVPVVIGSCITAWYYFTGAYKNEENND